MRLSIFLAAALCCGELSAANLLTATPSTASLSCNTVNGPGAAAVINIQPAGTLTTTSIAVTETVSGTGVTVQAPSPATLNASNQAQGLAYTVSMAPGCAGAINGSVTIRFFAGGTADVSVTVTTSVIATASPLVATPVVMNCYRSPATTATYTPGPAQTVAVTSAAAGGTPFTVNTTANPSWLTVTPTTGGSASATAVNLTVTAVSPCGGFAIGSSNSGSIHLKNAPAPDALIPVTLQVLGTSPLTATPSAPSLGYVKGSGTPATADVQLSAAGSTSPSFTVDPTTLPVWLTAAVLNGTAPQTLHFVTTSVADTLADGVYSASVHVQCSGFGDLVIPFRITISDPPPTLTVAEGTTRNLTWTIGQPLPIPYVTLVSSGAPIPYSVVTGGPLAPIVASVFQKGLAYNYDTPIPITFGPAVFAPAQPGNVLSGTVSIAWGSPAVTTVVTLNITVQPAIAVVQGLSPVNLPAAAPGQTFTVALSGMGFVAGSDPTQRTVAGIVSGGSIVADANITATVLNSATIILTLTVPGTADPLLPFDPSASGGTVVLGVCNPQGANCALPTGTATLTIGTNPLIQAVTSASSYVQTAPPALPVVAPYDMISLFGINFCTSHGTGCSGATLYGTPDPSTLRYPTSLSPDGSGPAARLVSVTFQTHAATPAAIGSAPLLFANDSQINLLVPVGVSAYVGKPVDIVVNFGSGVSAPFTVNIAAADPGIFTLGASGQGDAAVLGTDYSVIGQGNEAGMRQTAADSDTVQIFVTGLGEPDSTANNASAGSGRWPSDCVSETTFLSSLNKTISGSFTSLDGSLISSPALSTGRLVPCFQSAADIPSVTVGGRSATVTYAGWVPDAVAGVYQVNVKLPASGPGPFTTASGISTAGPLTAPVQLPLVITARNRSSQTGVTIWVAPKLKITGLTALSGTEGAAWAATGSAVTASEGTGPYQYAVTNGSLPAGLALNSATGLLSGTPAAGSAGSYTVTVTATDSASAPVTGSITLTLIVSAGK